MKFTSLLQNRVQNKGFTHTVASAQVCVAYDSLISKEFSEIGTSEAVKLEGGRLTVTASSPAQASFIRLHEEDILERLNSSFEGTAYAVERLTFEIT